MTDEFSNAHDSQNVFTQMSLSRQMELPVVKVRFALERWDEKFWENIKGCHICCSLAELLHLPYILLPLLGLETLVLCNQIVLTISTWCGEGSWNKARLHKIWWAAEKIGENTGEADENRFHLRATHGITSILSIYLDGLETDHITLGKLSWCRCLCRDEWKGCQKKAKRIKARHVQCR